MLIQEHKPTWLLDFQKIRDVIKEVLVDLEIKIEHVGSTAITHLAAKPIIDIDIVHQKTVRFEEINRRLKMLGYLHHGDQGIAGREVFKRDRQGESHSILDSINHHLYVCESESEELRRHLLFRNYLMENHKARQEYQKIKYELAERANQNKKVYAKLKETLASEFIEAIIKRAMEKK